MHINNLVSGKMGALIAITGPMFSGKTTELIRNLERAIYAKKKVIVFKPSLDNRYSESEVVAHSGIKYPAVVVPNTAEGVFELYKRVLEEKADVVGIDEAQFFPIELVDVVEELVKEGYIVIVAGLNLDFRGEPFETMREILVRADDIHYLKAVCTVCGMDATRTQRLIDGRPAPYESPRILVGGSEVYEARCRKHHIVPRREETKNRDPQKIKNKL